MNNGVPRRIAVVSLWAENVPATVHFYHDVLGLRLVPHHASARPHFEVGGVILIILPGHPHPASPERFPQLAFAVDDLKSAVKNLEAHQVHLPWGVEEDRQAHWVMFYDPAGNLVELVQLEEKKWIGGEGDK